MKRRLSQRRVILLGGLSILVGLGLAAAFLLLNRRLFTVGEWTDFLGPSERAAFEQASGLRPTPQIIPPLLAAPGLSITPLKTQRRGSCEVATFTAAAAPELVLTGPLAALDDFWKKKGLLPSPYGDMLLARDQGGVTYAARMTGLETGTPQLLLWQIRSIQSQISNGADEDVRAPGNTQSQISNLKSQIPVSHPSHSAFRIPHSTFENNPKSVLANLLPSASPDSGCTQLGQPGTPGYSLSVAVEASAPMAFRALQADLRKRGWESFGGDEELGKDPASLKRSVPGSYSMVFKHKTAPLGCQLLVQDGAGNNGKTQVLMALF